MMENKVLEIKVKELVAKKDWEGIIELLDAKESVPEGLSAQLLVNLGFAYGMYSKKIEKENKVPKKELSKVKSAILALAEQANVLALRRGELSETLYSMAIKNLAYTFYETFIGYGGNWFCESLGRRQQEVLVNKTRYKNLAAFLYAQIIRKYPNDIASFYRYGKLLLKASDMYRLETKYILDGKRTIKDSYSKYLKESFLVEFYSEAEIDEYIGYLPSKMSMFSYYGTEQLLQAVNLYENCTDEDVKMRQKKNYIKAMFGYCRMYLHEQEHSRAFYCKLNPSLVPTFLEKIMKEEGISRGWNVGRDEVRRYALGDFVGEDAKYIYKLLADCLLHLEGENMFHETSEEEKKRNLKVLKKSVFYASQACLVEILQRADRGNRYTFNRTPFDDFNIRYGEYLRTYAHLDERKDEMLTFFGARAKEIVAYYKQYYQTIHLMYSEEKKQAIENAVQLIEQSSAVKK